MKLAKRIAVIGTILILASLFVGCEGFISISGDWLSAPYGYIEDSEGNPVKDATVSVYRTSVTSTNLVQTAATTSATGYFTLTSKVDSKGGTYIIQVTPPDDSSLQFEDTTVEVPSTGYLFGIGTIKALGGFYSISGKVINVRVETQTDAIPTSGTVSIREFGGAALASATVGSDGTFSISGIESGNYLLSYTDATTLASPTALDPNWFGIPVSITVSNGSITNFGALVYNTTGMAAGDILLAATWNNQAYDIDSYSIIGAVGAVPTAAVGYNYSGSSTAIGVVPVASYNIGGNTVAWERDVTNTDITTAGVYPVETTLVSSLAVATEMRFYVRCYTSTGSISGLEGTTSVQPAGVTVYAMYLHDLETSYHYGTWFAPLDTEEKIVGMAELVGGVTLQSDDTLEQVAAGILSIGSFGWLDKYRDASGALDYTKVASPRALTGGVVVSSIR